jgi:hypothetical protein
MSKHKSTQTFNDHAAQETTLSTPEWGIWKNVFWGIFAVLSVAILFLASKAGINADEDFQVKYAESLVDWYVGVPRDTAKMTAVEKQCDPLNFTYRNANMHYYGGFFEIIAGMTNRVLGYKSDQLSYHTVRHLWIGVFGILAILFTALAVRSIVNWRAALIALGLLAISPYFIGNALMNPKDIPFCAGFAVAIYFMLRFFQQMPESINWKTIAGLSIGFAIALGTRAGGILLFAYFGLFALIHIATTYGLGHFFGNKQLWTQYLKYGLISAFFGYLGAILFWPYALQNPIANPFKALSEFDKFAIGIKVLFDGANVMSDKTPWTYAPRSIYQTTPLIVIIGFIAAIPLTFQMSKRFGFQSVFIALFAAIFPILYVIYKDSNMYNQWRHLLFVYPGIIMAASLSLYTIYEWAASKNKIISYALIGLIVVTSISPALHIAQNQGLSFIYYNEAVGGIKPQFGKNETDYWGMSVKNGIDYLEQHGILKPNMDKPVTIISNMGYALQTYTKQYGDKVKWLYASYPNRYKYQWDYALYTSLFVASDQIKSGNWPMKSSTIHAIDVGGVPVLAIMQQDSAQRVFKAQQATKNNDAIAALTLLQAEVNQHPDNEVAISNLAELYLNTGKFGEGKSTAEQLLKISPENTTAYYMKAFAQAQLGDINGSINSLQICLKLAPDYEPARALIQQLRSLKK